MRRILTALVVVALLLPIVVTVLLAVSRLLFAMDDAVGAAVLNRLALGAGILWGLDLIVLLIAQGVQSTLRPDEPPE